APVAAANLKRHPELASDFDRELLLDAGYSLESDGGVLDAKRAPLDEPALKGVLERLRAERKEKTLVDLESFRRASARTAPSPPSSWAAFRRPCRTAGRSFRRTCAAASTRC